MRIQIRFTDEETRRILLMMQSEVTGCETMSEFFRLLVSREWNLRRNLGKPVAKDWQTAHRMGTPFRGKRKVKLIWPHLFDGRQMAVN